MEKEVENIIASLSPIERKILPYLSESSVNNLIKKSGLDFTSVKRALSFLSNKNILSLSTEKKKKVLLDVNGGLYLKRGLPETHLLKFLEKNNNLSLNESKKSGLTDDEFKVALGTLKGKALISIENGKIILKGKPKEGKSLEEKFLASLPLELNKLEDEQKYALEQLKKRKKIIKIEEVNEISFSVTNLGKQVTQNIGKVKVEFIEELTLGMIKTKSWKNKQFRRYDIKSKAPTIYGGKKHFVNQAIDYAKKIWLEMGFQEMKGDIIQTSFWNFDALFIPQDHPAREMQDTFFLEEQGKLPEKKIIERVKKSHEKGVAGSKGWQYSWKEEEAKKLVLRTHTTPLSAQTLAKLKKSDLPAKFFAIGRNYRNETLDWKHLFEFNQTEGIVVDKNANFRHLLGYLKEFAKKMGYKKVRFRPSYFPYTEPSLEGDVWHEEKKEWMEVFAAGIFRPEVTEPLLGEPIPVLAWGPGFDRMVMLTNKIKDARELYKNDIEKLRKIKVLIK